MTSSHAGASSAARLPEQSDARGPSAPDPDPRPDSAGGQRDTLTRRIGVLTAGILGVLIVVSAVSSVALLLSARTVTKLATGYAPAADANSAALVYMLDAETGLRGYALTGRRSYLQPYHSSVRRIVPTINAIANTLSGIGDHSIDAKIVTERRIAQGVDRQCRHAVDPKPRRRAAHHRGSLGPRQVRFVPRCERHRREGDRRHPWSLQRAERGRADVCAAVHLGGVRAGDRGDPVRAAHRSRRGPPAACGVGEPAPTGDGRLERACRRVRRAGRGARPGCSGEQPCRRAAADAGRAEGGRRATP